MKVNPSLLIVLLLLLLSDSYVNAGPVGDFFKKVGHSISKPLQREPEPPQPQPQAQPQSQSTGVQPAKTPHPARRTTPRAGSSSATTSPAAAQPSHADKEEEPSNSVRPLSAAEIEKVKAGLPYGVPVPGRKGMVTSPYTPEDEKYIDVNGFASGSIVKDPYTGKFFLVP
jgi:hypothetical protein